MVQLVMKYGFLVWVGLALLQCQPLFAESLKDTDFCRNLPLPAKVSATVEIRDSKDPSQNRKVRAESYYLRDALILHYWHTRGEIVVATTPAYNRVDYWMNARDPYVRSDYLTDGFTADFIFLCPLYAVHRLSRFCVEPPAESFIEIHKSDAETTVAVITPSTEINREKDVHNYILDHEGRLRETNSNTLWREWQRPNGTLQRRQWTRWTTISLAGYELSPDPRFPTRVEVTQHYNGRQISAQIDSVTVLPASTSAKDILPELTKSLPRKRAGQQLHLSPTDFFTNMYSTLVKARAFLVAIVVALGWILMRRRSQRRSV